MSIWWICLVSVVAAVPVAVAALAGCNFFFILLFLITFTSVQALQVALVAAVLQQALGVYFLSLYINDNISRT